ncbi:hypothetical protein ACFS7Z_13800 [Pontibacter toksunensis]|uniref:MYXO-CTERM domain-containing protein n=1 Tax=Pontibacter toksunensis TaxID=1332631 RepID=A0ABW6BV76_9BACT
MKNITPKPQQINSGSGSNQVQALAPTTTASQAITADPAAAPAPEKAGIPWLMVGVAAVVGLSLINGKGSKGSGLSGVPSKKGAKKSATRKVKRMSV